jgi:zinc transporter, ZIP family
MNALWVFVFAVGTAVATGLGVLPLAVVRTRTERWIALSSALAAGFMVGASIGLTYEGWTIDEARTLIGALAGVLFVVVSRRLLRNSEHLHIGELRGAGARKALLIVGVMTVHSFTEGAGVGVSFADSDSLGLLIAVAIAVHNIPEGLAIGLVLVPQGTSLRAAAAWAVFSSLPQPLMAVPSYLGVKAVHSLLPAGLGFAAGAMLWLALAYMVPGSLKEASRPQIAAAVVLGAGAMVAFGVWFAF